MLCYYCFIAYNLDIYTALTGIESGIKLTTVTSDHARHESFDNIHNRTNCIVPGYSVRRRSAP